jgi:hypothetical protein
VEYAVSRKKYNFFASSKSGIKIAPLSTFTNDLTPLNKQTNFF